MYIGVSLEGDSANFNTKGEFFLAFLVSCFDISEVLYETI